VVKWYLTAKIKAVTLISGLPGGTATTMVISTTLEISVSGGTQLKAYSVPGIAAWNTTTAV
jgi:hypothetical protein